jgi:tRNA threonylcarbamoyladenosine biosynthesis protein TsaB
VPSTDAPGRLPLILALDTSSSLGSIALTRGSEMIGENAFEANPGHSTRLLPAIDALFRAAGISAADIDLFAAVVGPGSFTGLRVSLACVRGLALGKPCFGAIATDVAAFAARGRGAQTLAVTDLFHGEVFATVHDRDGRRLSGHEAGELPLVVEKLRPLLVSDVVAAGSATLRHRQALSTLLPDLRFVELPEGLAPHLAMLAARDATSANTVPAPDLLPFYLRDPITRGLLDPGRAMG